MRLKSRHKQKVVCVQNVTRINNKKEAFDEDEFHRLKLLRDDETFEREEDVVVYFVFELFSRQFFPSL